MFAFFSGSSKLLDLNKLLAFFDHRFVLNLANFAPWWETFFYPESNQILHSPHLLKLATVLPSLINRKFIRWFMRQKSLFVRVGLVCLFLVYFANFAFSQKSINSKLLPSSHQKLEKKLSNIFSMLISSETPNSSVSIAYRKNITTTYSKLTKFNLNLNRRKGIQSLFSMASGISQINENQPQIQLGLVSSNGQRATSNSFTVDGLSSNLGASADETSISKNIGSLPTLTASNSLNAQLTRDSMSEINIRTIAAAKEGRTTGATIDFSSQSGTNKYHGSLFENFGNEVLNANDYFANARGLKRAPSRLNQFGGTLGGFIKRDRSFFFANYEGLRLRQTAFGISEVPSLISRQTASINLRPILNAFAIPNGQSTTSGFAEFAANYTNPAAHNIFGLRIDNNVANNLRISGRYNFAGSNATWRGDKGSSLNTLRQLDTKTNSLSVWSDFTPSSTVVIGGRVNFSRNRLAQKYTIDNFGGANVANVISSGDFTKFDFTGKNSALAFGNQSKTVINQFQTIGTVDWVYNNHTFAFGTDFRRLGYEIGSNPTERNVLFAGITQGLGGTASRINEISRLTNQTPNANNFSLFAQDVWRITPRFNVNLGLRWETDTAPQIDKLIVNSQNATSQIPNNFKNFAPRVSVAIDPSNSGKTVLRGGISLYYDFGNSPASEIFANSFPSASGNFVRNVNFLTLPNIAIKPLIVFNQNLQTPRTWQVYAEIQKEFFGKNVFTFNYSAALGRKLFLTRTLINADSNYNYIRLTDNSAASDYQALQIRFERRFSNGFSFNSRYTLSKSTDNFSPDAMRENNFVSSDLKNERGISDFDNRHNLSIYAIYDIPILFSESWKKLLTQDWSISAVANARSAFPVNVTYARINDFGKEFVRPDLINNVPLYLNVNGIKQLNPNAFAIPNVNRQGSLERNSLRGFSLFQLDASLQRQIRITSDVTLNLTVQSFNLLNTHNFADMSGNFGTQFSSGNFVPNSYFGKVVSTFGGENFTSFNLYGGARTVQFSAKFVF
jgi:hypothetical protein